MGVPERLVERQLSRGKGDAAQRFRVLMWSKNLMLATALLGLLTSGLNLATGSRDAAGVFWTTFGAGWVVLGYVALRQRLYLNRQQQR